MTDSETDTVREEVLRMVSVECESVSSVLCELKYSSATS